ncbi:hypothetical protein D3C87_2138790 [compost metagenome]
MGQHRPLDQNGAVAEFRHGAEIMRRDQHDATLGPELPQQGDDLVLGLDVDSGEGLVEQDDPAVLG